MLSEEERAVIEKLRDSVETFSDFDGDTMVTTLQDARTLLAIVDRLAPLAETFAQIEELTGTFSLHIDRFAQWNVEVESDHGYTIIGGEHPTFIEALADVYRQWKASSRQEQRITHKRMAGIRRETNAELTRLAPLQPLLDVVEALGPKAPGRWWSVEIEDDSGEAFATATWPSSDSGDEQQDRRAKAETWQAALAALAAAIADES